MFKSAATKLAHNSTLPALAGNRDLRPLQDLITTEKAVLTSLQRLSGDLIKSSDCLRAWGAGEGDDLQDVLSASTTLLGYVASALAQLALHEATIREHMKAVRTQEESLDELRKRRKTLSAKADAADRKLTKMSTENKGFQQQTELLNNLREQIRNLDWEILTDEAKLGDFKRTQTKNWMALKFGGLLECAEKTTIVGEMGKLVIEEIPLVHTEPGQSRPFYTGHEKVEKLITESQRCVSEVTFDPNPVAGSSPHAPASAMATAPSNIDGLPSSPTQDDSAYLQDSVNGGPGFDAGMTTDEFGGLSERPSSRGYGTMPMPSGPMRISEDGSRIATLDSNTSRGPMAPAGSRYGAQFSTFPTRKASLPPAAVPPPPPPTNLGFQSFASDDASSSFASEVANALAYAEQSRTPEPTGRPGLDGPAPSYEPKTWASPTMADSGLPRGAAPPAERNPWEGAPSHEIPEPQGGYPVASIPPQQHEDGSGITPIAEEEESELPYASPPPAFSVLPRANEPENHQSFTNPSFAQQTTQHMPEPSEDEDELNAAAAREVARELDALTFRPPPGPPPGHTENRSPSPLEPPALPFVQPLQPAMAPAYGGNLPAIIENGSYGPRHDIRGSSQTLNLDTSPRQASGPGSPISANSSAPYGYSSARGPASASMPSNINVQAPSPIPSAYATPPELPSAQPLRTGSPSVVTPGARTISASAFKRPQMRTPSGGVSPMTPDGSRTLPDVSPLSLRKKSGLPSSPAPSHSSHSREPASADEQGQQGRGSNDSARQGEDGAYDAIDSYAARRESQEEPGSPGYGRGKFATNLEKDSLL